MDSRHLEGGKIGMFNDPWDGNNFPLYLLPFTTYFIFLISMVLLQGY